MLTKGIENRPSLRKSVHPLILTPGASLVTQTMPLQAVMPLAEAWVRYLIPYSITHHLAMVHGSAGAGTRERVISGIPLSLFVLVLVLVS